jgi:predicted nucleic acid-binding protein
VILVDTGPLVALCNPGDALNRIALRDLDRVASEPLFLCPPILTETCFLLRRHVHRARLDRMLTRLSVQAYRDDDEEGLWREVFEWLAVYREHQPDWADGYLAVVSGKDRRFSVWTYDSEFRTTWRRPDGTAIPLAIPKP